MASFEGLEEDFRVRLQQLIAASNGRIRLGNGLRTREQQARLYAEKPDLAAPPGRSNHEKGLAGDLEGDLALAARLAPQFGLYLPMGTKRPGKKYEPWHVEPIRGEKLSPNAGFDPPEQDDEGERRRSPAYQIASFMGIVQGKGAPKAQGGLKGAVAKAPRTPAGVTGIEDFMNKLSGVESGGSYTAANRRTGAAGRYQIMPGNWPSWSREAGLPANAPRTPENQERVARFKMEQYRRQFGSWEAVAVAWYAGPDDAAVWVKNPNDRRFDRKPTPREPTIREYVQRVSGPGKAA